MEPKLWIKSDGALLNVTTRGVICYGAGKACVEICNEIQLPNIQYVIDRNKDRQKIQLCNHKYEIQSSQILKKLAPDKYYIFISSTKYTREIMDDIRTYIGDSIPVCNGSDQLFYVYESLEEMLLCDPFIQRKIVNQHGSFSINEYVKSFKQVVSNCLEKVEIKYFTPIKRGSKIIFIFGNDQKQWVFSVPGVFSFLEAQQERWGGMTNDIDVIRERYEIKRKYRLEDKLTIYEDHRGYLLQHYACEVIDFSDKEIRAKVLKQCRCLHQLDAVIKIERNATKRYKQLLLTRNTIGKTVSDTERDLIDKMEPYIQYLDNPDMPKRVCHGDLHHGNIVVYDGEIFFIDWEFLCRMDPMYDVCRFLYYSSHDEFSTYLELYEENISRLYRELPDYLADYYGRKCTLKEYEHAFAMMLLCENIELLLRATAKGQDTEKMAELILKHMNRYDEMEETI